MPGKSKKIIKAKKSIASVAAKSGTQSSLEGKKEAESQMGTPEPQSGRSTSAENVHCESILSMTDSINENENNSFDLKQRFISNQLKLLENKFESDKIKLEANLRGIALPLSNSDEKNLSPQTQRLAYEMPKVELETFDGNPRNYCRFMQQFKFFVEEYEADPGRRLLYLMHYCKGNARAAIGDCVLLPPTEGYGRAREILSNLFGQRSQVIEAIMTDLLNNPRLSPDNPQSVMNFAIRLRSCDIAISQLTDISDGESSSNIEQVVKHLPSEFRRGWARRADEICRQGQKIKLGDLCSFLETEARIVNSAYGRLAIRQREYNKPSMNRSSCNAINTPQNCPCCKAPHKIDECVVFKSLKLSQRWKSVKSAALCFACLGSDHRIKECSGKQACVSGCTSNLHPLLHFHEAENAVVGTCRARVSQQISLNTVPVRIMGEGKYVDVYALLDSGSEVTIVRRDVIDYLGLQTKGSSTILTTLTGQLERNVGETRLSMKSLDGAHSLNLDKVIVVDNLNVKPANVVEFCSTDSSEFPDCHVRLKDLTVKLIIGADVPEAHWALEQRKLDSSRAFAIKTMFGWCVFGYLDRSKVSCFSISVSDSLKLLYDREFGDLEDQQSSLSIEDQKALSLVETSTRIKDGHYEIALPWKSDPEALPNNYQTALSRLNSLQKRFSYNADLERAYSDEIKRCVEKGYLAKVPKHQLSDTYPRRWYLPHHAVTHPGKSGKVRIVYDCAAKFGGSSLNDTLFQGPDLTNKLLEVLLRFREGAVAIAADIEGMFMQVRVPEQDRGLLRILWNEGINLKDPTEYQLTSHPFGAVSSPFCANYALRRTAQDFGNGYADYIVKSIFENFYVDDCLKSLPGVKHALEFAKSLSKMLASNRREVLESVSREEPDTKSIEMPETKILGIEWWPAQDLLCFRFSLPEKPTTKRGILSIIASFYDPIGCIAPILLPARIILQRICRAKYGWDDDLGEEGQQWNQWKEAMSKMKPLLVPRCVGGNFHKGMEIHSFCDASELGYGAVVYATIPGAPTQVYLLFAKSRVAPLKTVSIPRLELCAATLATRITKKVKDIYRLYDAPTVYWTDSTIVLYYIQNESKRFSTFVANRLTTIHYLSSVSQWKHVLSKENPADMISRGVACNEQLSKWVEGPAFLRESRLRSREHEPVMVPPSDVEVKSRKMESHSVTEHNHSEDKFARWSDWHKILTCLSWLTRFKRYMMVRSRIRPGGSSTVGPITAAEIKQAEIDLIGQIQRHHFDCESIITSSVNTCKSSSLWKLNPIMVNGLVRIGGRSYGENGPLLIPKKHWVAERILTFYHQREGHAGPVHVISCVRERYWIIGGLVLAKRICHRCLVCRVQLARAQGQQMSALPMERYTPQLAYPFSYVGLDFFGPFHVKVHRKSEKRYACILTCVQVRAIHIEVTHDLSTDSFILALMRFIARRGAPVKIFSDNGSNLVGAVSELKQAIKNLSQSTVRSKLLYRGVEWKFNPPYSSHRGGIWERMIRSVRRIINSIANLNSLTDDALVTLMCEAERVVNNRPLTSVSSNPSDPQPLTPNHFLNLRSSDQSCVAPLTDDRCRRQWKLVNYLADVFWKRWLREYLPTLQKRQKWIAKERCLEKGDIVLISDTRQPRNSWPLGIIIEAIRSDDGLVRTVKVKSSEGELIRDIRKIYLVEAMDESSDHDSSGPAIGD